MVSSNGRVEDDLMATDIVINGSVVGNTTASGRVELKLDAEVQGDIRAKNVTIHKDARHVGKVHTYNKAPQVTQCVLSVAFGHSSALARALEYRRYVAQVGCDKWK